MKEIRIGTRASKLAVVQAEMVADVVRQAAPGVEVRLVKLTTTGDKFLNTTLDKIGGKGVFVKELDQALKNGEVDFCVHCCKDLPTTIDPAMPLVAVSPREDPRDVLILPKGIDRVDPEKPIGCSSLRRQVQLKALYPGHGVAPVRGNVLTRLEKLDRGEFSALVLAAAGIKRLGLWERVSRVFTPEEILPAGGQGTLVMQGCAGRDYAYLAGYHDRDAESVTLAERAFIERLDCGCGAPVGVFGLLDGEELYLRGLIADVDGTLCRDEIKGNRGQAVSLGSELAGKMLKRVDVQWANMATSY